MPLANVLKSATGRWETVFLVAAATNVIVVLLALFVLRPMRASQVGRVRLTAPPPRVSRRLTDGVRCGRRVRMTKAERFAMGSLGAGCLVLGLKGAAWWLTGSAALYSDALESTVNVAASLIAWAALRFAARPADANHPYGHDKAEFFAAVIEGVHDHRRRAADLCGGMGKLVAPAPAGGAAGQGIALNAVATAINGSWAAVLLTAGRRLRSPALQADGRHLVADVVTSVGVAGGVMLAVVTGQYLLDPLLAAATGVYVLWSALRMISSLRERPDGRGAGAGGGEADQGRGGQQRGGGDRGA